MKKKTYIALISALTISGAFLLNGCSFELPGTDATVSAGTELSAEKEILTDGNLQLYSRWYDASGEKLANATVTITDGNETVFEGTTDENGTLEMCTIPGNKELRCVVTNESGDQIAKSDILYKISNSYDSIMIYSTHGESDTQKVEVPTSKQQLSVAIYLTDNKTLSHANITEYTAGTQADTSADGPRMHQRLREPQMQHQIRVLLTQSLRIPLPRQWIRLRHFRQIRRHSSRW